MTKITFYPLGNADCCLIQTEKNRMIAFDFADMNNADDPTDRRMPLAKNFKEDIGWPTRKDIDVLAVTHGDDDHVRKISETFWLNHAGLYQGDDRIKFHELWVPAALLVEEGAEDHTRIIRQEARHRFLKEKRGIRVFSRPEHLKDWLEKRGEKLDDYRHLITNAGELVPGFDLSNDNIEFFVHSPFAKRTDDGLLDRNDNCLVMQAVIRSGVKDSRFLITADSVADTWADIITITRAHKNDHRLAWDVFKIPHHCSYLSMAKEKGASKTTPTPEFEWLLSQGAMRSTMVSSSWPIPSESTAQPPHVETYRRYVDTARSLDADIAVTMERPSEKNPQRTIIEIDGNGSTLKKQILSTGAGVASTVSPRMG